MRRALEGLAVRAAAVVLIAMAAACAAAATAIADVEPNNVISQAEGPVAGGALIAGVLATPDDVDYYVFYGASQQQLHLTSSDLTNDPRNRCVSAGFEDANGQTVANDYTTPPGVNRYFVHISYDGGYGCKNPDAYRFQIDPGAGVTTGPALDHALVQTPEPNETPGQANGPLQAGVNYVGAHETTNDEDWFFFFVPPGTHQLDLSATAPVRGDSSCDSQVELFGSAGSTSSVASTRAGWSTYGHINETLTGPSQYYVRAGVDYSPCLGARWQFRIETPDAVTAVNPFAPPPPPPPPVAPPPPPPPAGVPARTQYASAISLRRRGARYSGKVSSVRIGCQVGRRVVLRRNRSGLRNFDVTHTRSNGTFTIQRAGRLRGQVYVKVSQRIGATTICASATSRSIRG